MKKNFPPLLAILIASLAAACAPELSQVQKPPKNTKTNLYTGHGNSEAVVEFDYRVQIRTKVKPTPKQAHDAIEAQVTHLFGPLSAAVISAAPKENHTITKIQVLPAKPVSAGFIASYHYAGTMVVGNQAGNQYTVTLPRNPKTIYKKAITKVRGKLEYPCTDEHYNSEDDFWYFWNPDQPGCQLEEGRDFDRIDAKVTRIRNTVKTYPDYERLAGRDGTIQIAVFFGMDEETSIKNPLKSADLNSENFRAIRQSLVNLGFTSRVSTRTEITAMLGFRPSPFPYLETLTKKNSKATLVIRLFFGPTGIDENSAAFHHLYKSALEQASVMIYDGHSGLGGHLDLADIESTEQFKITPDPSRYQIYFFNSCTSYTYFNTDYFARKQTSADPRGTKNLDILANGLATAFDVMHDTNLALLRAIDAWSSGKAKTSYQELAAQIDSENLFGVIGDEDNPTH